MRFAARVPVAVIDLRISVAREAGRTVMALEGELDLATTHELEVCLRQDDVAGADVVMDVSQLSFIDASGLRALVAAYRAAVQRGHSLILTGTSPPLERLLALTGGRRLLGLGEPVT